MNWLRSFWSVIRRHPFLSGAAITVGIFIIAAIGARMWINSDGGRAYALSQIDGRTVGSLGTLSARGLTGDPLTEVHLAHLSIADDQGVWLVASDIRLKWTPRALVSRHVDLNLLSAGELSIARRPVTASSDSGAGSGQWSVELDDLAIGKLDLAEGVAGPAAAFSVAGRFASVTDGTLDAQLDISPLEGMGDRFKLDAKRNAAGQFMMNAQGTAPAGGTFATLLHLEDGQDATLTASADGTLKEGDGYFLLRISDEDAAAVTAKIVDGRLTANADVNALTLPLPDTIRTLAGANARVILGADIKKHLADFDLSGKFASGDLTLAGQADIDKKTLNGPAALKLDFTGLDAVAGLAAHLVLDGNLTVDDGVPSYAGQAALVANKGADLFFRQLAGPLEATLGSERIPFKGTLIADGLFGDNQTLSKLTGTAPTIVASGAYDRTTGMLTFAPSAIALADGRIAVSGNLATRAGTLDIRGTADQSLLLLPGGLTGRAAGPFRISGKLKTPQIETSLKGTGFGGLPDSAQPLIGPAPNAKLSVQVGDNAVQIQTATITGAGLSLDGGGTYSFDGDSAVAFRFSQTEPLPIGDNTFDLHEGTLDLKGPMDALVLTVASQNGAAQVASRNVEQLVTHATLSLADGEVSGPVSLNASVSGETLDVAARFLRNDDGVRVQEMSGTYGPLVLSGNAIVPDGGGLSVVADIAGEGLKTDTFSVASVQAHATVTSVDGSPMAIVIHVDGTRAQVRAGIAVDTFSADISNNTSGYDFKVSLANADPARPFDFDFSGTADLSGTAPHGTFQLSGSAFAEPFATAQPARWSLGDAPDLDMRLAVLGGQISADLSGTGAAALLALDIENVDFGALFALAGAGKVDARLNGRGEFHPVGLSPSGTFAFNAISPVPGLETSLSLDVTGRLNASTLSVNARSNYGKGLVLNADAALPVKASADALVQIDRTAPLTGRATLKGDLSALHTAALAYGHDIGGDVDALATMSGSLSDPVYKAKANVANGVYEFGASGLRLTGVTLDAAYADNVLSMTGAGNSNGDGSVKLAGSLGAGKGRIDADLSRLLAYQRNGDSVRLSGKIAFSDNDAGRLVSGDLTIDEARFSLDNLPSAGPKAIDVRWKDGDVSQDTPSRLRQSVKLDLGVSATRRVVVTGRGLDSEWALDLRATGAVSAVQLNGQATLVRGNLDLAGRPFIFDSGKVTFDGPLDSARIAVDAERTANGFVARVQVTGKPTRPTFELSSTPDLPQDEILSRLLFGRSSMDLSPVEAAQLASSINRLSGGDSFDPTARLQAALGLDRLSVGSNDAGNAEVGVGQYLADDVYLQLQLDAAGGGSSVEVEWEPAPQVSVTSETTSTGENKVAIRWKKDY